MNSNVCKGCGGTNGNHNKVRYPYPWPFNLVAIAIFQCPYTPEGQKS